MAAVLRAAGFDVREGQLETDGAEADVAVVAVDDALNRRRLQGLNQQKVRCRLVLVGDWQDAAPAPFVSMSPLARPVRHDTLLVRVRQALAGAPAVGPTPLDRTAAPAMTSELGGHTEAAPVLTAMDPVVATQVEPTPAAEPLQGAVLSAHLVALMARTSEEGGEPGPPLVLEGQADSAQHLAPDVMLGLGGLSAAALEDEGELTPLELAVPAGDVPRPQPARASAVRPKLPEQEPWLSLSDPLLGNPRPDGQSRAGALGTLGLAPLLWRLVELALDVELRVGAVQLRFMAGELRDVLGDIYRRTLAVFGEARDDEAQCQARLRERVVQGQLRELHVARALREAREEAVSAVLCSDVERFELLTLPETDRLRLSVARRPLSLPIRALSARACRTRLGEQDLQRVVEEGGGFQLEPDAAQRMQEFELEPELIELLERHSGRRLAGLLAEADPGDGMPGLLCLLGALGAVRFPR